MKSAFDQEISGSAPEFLNTFGVECFINGVNYRVIFNDAEYNDEAGYRHDLSIEIIADQIIHLREGDRVLIGGTDYAIRQIPEASTEDPFVKVGLKRA